MGRVPLWQGDEVHARPGRARAPSLVSSRGGTLVDGTEEVAMIRRLRDGRYRLYSRSLDPRTGHRRHLGTFATRVEAVAHERAIHFFKRRRRAR